MKDKNVNLEAEENEKTVESAEEVSHEQSLKLMSPMQMVIRRFFRSKLSIIGLIMVVSLFLFCWVGPLVYTQWGPAETDMNGNFIPKKIKHIPPKMRPNTIMIKKRDFLFISLFPLQSVYTIKII